MPPSWHFDWSTFWLLAALTAAEGVRRVPAGGLLLRHVAGYPWHVAAGPYRAAGWRLASALPPLALHCLVQPAQGEPRQPPRRGRMRLWVTLVRFPSLLALAALLAGVPLLSASMGTTGLIVAIAAAFGASLLTAMLSMIALVRLGTGWKTAAGDALRIVSPFTSPRAPEMVLERAMTGVPAVEAARALLPPHGFAAWLRPLAYDERARGAEDGLVPRDEAERVVRAPPADAARGDAYCPRCAGIYLPGAESCRGCGGVPLARVLADESSIRKPVAAGG